MAIRTEVLHLDAVLRKVHPDFLAALAPGATIAQLDELEQLVGQPLPPILRDLGELLTHRWGRLRWSASVGSRGDGGDLAVQPFHFPGQRG